MKYLWSVSTGHINHFKPTSVAAAKYIKSLDGFEGIFKDPHGVLWMFDSEYNAISARNLMKAKDILCGTNICKFSLEDGVLKLIQKE